MEVEVVLDPVTVPLLWASAGSGSSVGIPQILLMGFHKEVIYLLPQGLEWICDCRCLSGLGFPLRECIEDCTNGSKE